ncbi:MAG: glycosyltransferase, partial [Hyphomicrobiales bacterium]|nr:glycosyltransferase [Hyphomicrobiales bacterium]
MSKVTYVVERDLSAERLEQGWSSGHLSSEFVLAPARGAARELVAASSANAIHVFSGIHGPPAVAEALKTALGLRRRFGLLGGPRALDGSTGLGRFVRAWRREGPLRGAAGFVLAVGCDSPHGRYRQDRIFPFAEFVGGAEHQMQSFVGKPRVTFLGRFTKASGVNLFLEAVRRTPSDLHVEIAGAGPEEAAVHAAAMRGRNSPRYLGGSLPANRVRGLLARTDILVAPALARGDEWGAAVGEALLQGAAVVATDRVGASVCLEAPWRGRVVRRLDAAAIAEAVESLIQSDELRPQRRLLRADWARRRLTGAAGARYLLDILSHVYDAGERPKAFYE